jgi:sugar transferase (PEP-CTERM/EpsH1 system associated)
MRILVVCHRFPFPPTRGGKIRPFNIIRHLTERGHDVTVASLTRTAKEAEDGQGIERFCRQFLVETIGRPAAVARMVARLPTLTPSAMGYFYSPRLARRIRQALAQAPYDLIFVHCAFVAPYVADVRGVRKILDFGDMDSQKWLEYARVKALPVALGYRLEGAKMQRAEAALAKRFDLCTCTTRAELDTLRSYGVDVPVGWFPNGVDLEYFKPDHQPYHPDSICFVGRMDYFPNQECMVEFCRETLPLIQARRPGATLTIVGAAPPTRIRDLARRPGVVVTGSVPDVRPYVRRAAVTVAPLRIARGTQNKILEALAMGVPTVASVTAAGGVDAEPGRDFLTASTPAEHASAVIRLLENPDERHRFAVAGRVRMESHHDWSRSMQILDRLILDPTGAGARESRPGDIAVSARPGLSN